MSKGLSFIVAAVALAAGSAHATPIRLDGAETNLQQIANNLSAGVNVVTDQYAADETWKVNSPSGFGSSMIQVELAGYAGSNRFGLYDLNNSNNRVQLFSGAASAGAIRSFSIHADGRVFLNSLTAPKAVFSGEQFGFYLDTPVGTWFSQSSLNSDRGDHMVAYQADPKRWGPNSFLLGWEDLSVSRWDQDYNDMVLTVRDVSGVTAPEPGTLGLLGFGLAGAGVFGRRRKQSVAKS